MFNPEKTDYPRNAADEPEFASIILTLDAVSNNPQLGDHVVQKFVLSTQDSVEALSNVAGYFGEPDLLSRPANARLLMEAGRRTNPVFVYLTPRAGTTQIITSTPTWDMLVQHPSFGRTSALVTSEKMQQVIAQHISNVASYAGGFPELHLLDFSNIDEDAEAQQRESGSSQGGAGDDAERMVRTADIEEV